MGTMQLVPQRKILLAFVVLGSLIWVLSSLNKVNLPREGEIAIVDKEVKDSKYHLEKLEDIIYSNTNTPVKGFRKKYASVCSLLHPPVELEYNLCSLSVERILVEMRKIDVVTNYTMVFKRITNPSNDLKTFAQSERLNGKVYLVNSLDENVVDAKHYISSLNRDISVQVLEDFEPSFQYMKEVLFPKGTRKQTYPMDMDSLEIDIDSYDCELLETMLSLSSPKLVVLEFNPLFPPKVVYMQKYKKGHSNIGGVYHGCSLSAATLIASKYNYKLLYTRLFEAFYIKNEYSVMFRGLPSGERDAYSSGQYQKVFLDYLSNKGINIPHSDTWVPIISNWLDIDLLISSDSSFFKSNKPTKIEKAIDIIKTSIEYTKTKDLDYWIGTISEASNPVKIKKKFIYAAQGPGFYSFLLINASKGEIPAKLKNLITSNSDLIYLSFKQNANGTIFMPGSTWTTGRNRLYEEILKKEKQQGWGYLYYIFMDGDVAAHATDAPEYIDFWRRYERFLLRYLPAIGVHDFEYGAPPNRDSKFGKRWEAVPMYHFDAIVNAFHREAVGQLLPYDTRHDAISWWYSQLLMFHKSFLLYRHYQLEYYGVRSWNPEHNEYPRQADFDTITKAWVEEAVPLRLVECIQDFGRTMTRGTWGNARRKNIRYDSRTLYNVPSCKPFNE